MEGGIDDGFTEGVLAEKPDFLPFNDPVRFIGLEDVEDVAISENLIQGIKQALVSEFPDGIELGCLGLPGEYRHPDRHLGIVGEELGKEIVFPVLVSQIKILLKRLLSEFKSFHPIISEKLIERQVLPF